MTIRIHVFLSAVQKTERLTLDFPRVCYSHPCKPCGNLGCAFAVEGHGNDGLSLIGGKVAALAVMIDAIPGLLLGLSPLWLVSVVMCSFSLLNTSYNKLSNIISKLS